MTPGGPGVIYNEIEPYAVEWLRNLSDEGHIARGEVDSRSIRDLQPADVATATQFHAFAGIGAWSYALRLAGWPDDAPVWTGSCPCQPFSTAGKRRGTDDPRHLWPEWRRLIAECNPPIVFGEQVASPAGRSWLAAVRAEMEALGYVFGAADLCAAGVGAPHIRQRLFFGAVRVGDANEARLEGRWPGVRQQHGNAGRACEEKSGSCTGTPNSLAYAKCGDRGKVRADVGRGKKRGTTERLEQRSVHCGSIDTLAVPPSGGRERLRNQPAHSLARPGRPALHPWADPLWIPCRDGKARPAEPGTFPLAHGVAGRMAVVRTVRQAETTTQETHWYNRTGALKGFGNAIVPQVAATFIQAFLEAAHETVP